MSIQLRGHHLLCLLGFRGMGYSPEFAINMTAVYEQLRNNPATMVTLVRGADDLCSCYPLDKPNHCDTKSVHDRDDTVLARLGLMSGTSISWQEILQLLEKHMVPGDIPLICGSCPWQPYGVCEEGVARVSAGKGLSPLPIGHNNP
ncbi:MULTISPECIES: DUF1284 domain-containing protein [unclassified Paenibacillus]|uniref:DUF1284 domain-containing protein n=1 Tax=unclassified Paenibacillus TaxID=185978 RepID=UPI001AE144BC|nr:MULTISPECIES: DUF1284 domain-containing protein [unclassified Paenibacillus]MBP1155558.1 hypothetical protein [Paenibacillus sp. PvP091]MBP1169056.1 hypothetical protein [Paenibacillus sp. PvR098]MBP2440084.1 hypothetical protein [Paenibacillus sp. PvP052]